MPKFVIVTSFDEPEGGGAEFHGLVKEVLEILKPLVEHQANHHVWVGAKEHAQAVLNVIGVD